jgi:hypothetical protein
MNSPSSRAGREAVERLLSFDFTIVRPRVAATVRALSG